VGALGPHTIVGEWVGDGTTIAVVVRRLAPMCVGRFSMRSLMESLKLLLAKIRKLVTGQR
jgi:hypothetical protein